MTAHPLTNTRRFSVYSGFGFSLYLLIVFGPLMALLVNTAQALGRGNHTWLTLAIPTGRRLDLLLQSLSTSAAIALGGMLLGILVGVRLLNWSGKTRSVLRWFLLLLTPIPPYIHALAWRAAVDFVNQLFRTGGLSPIPMRGWGASCWVWIMALAPLAISLVLIGLDSVDTQLIEAAKIQKGDLQVMTGIIMPLARPYILAAGGLLFTLSLTDYSIASLFQMNSFALDIFAEFGANNQPARALLLSLPTLVTSFGVIGLVQAPLKNAALSPIWQRNNLTQNWHWPGWFQWLQRFGIFILFLQIAVPFLSLLFLTNSWHDFSGNIASSSSEIFFTLGVCILSALASLPVAFSLATVLTRTEHWFWWLLISLPLAIPAPLTGIGLINLWNQAFISQVYNSWMMPVLAALARFTPIAALIMTAQLRRINPRLIEAAEILQPRRIYKSFWIRLPLVGPGLLAGTLLTFILSLGELGATLLVVPAGKSTLTIRIYNFLHYGASETVASLCLAITLLALGFGMIAALILFTWGKWMSQS